MALARPDGYVQWLAMLESRVATQATPGPFGLPAPGVRPTTAPPRGGASGSGTAVARLSSVPQQRRLKARPQAFSQAALSHSKHPTSQGASDWGSAPLGVVQSEAQIEKFSKLRLTYEHAIQRQEEEIQLAGRERNEKLADAEEAEAEIIRKRYQERVAIARSQLKEMKIQHKEVSWRLDRCAAQALDWGATVTPVPASRDAALAGGGGQSVVGLTKARAPAVWRPVGKVHTTGHQGPGTSYAPPAQRLSKLEAARARAHDALVTSQRQRAAEVAENKAWLAHLDEEIYRASMQMHATFKGEYRVTLTHNGAQGFGMSLQTDNQGVTRVVAIQRNGSAAAAGVVVGSEVVAVAGSTLERGQGQDGLVPIATICGAAAVEFRFRRPRAKRRGPSFTTDFEEYRTVAEGRPLVTVQYCAGHLHARYEWQAAQLRDALVDQFPEITVLPKPIDPHAPRNREKTGAFEVQLCYRQPAPKGGLVKVLLFSKLKRAAFPRLDSLLDQLQKLQDEGCWKAFSPKVHFDAFVEEEERCDDDHSALELPESAPQNLHHHHEQQQQQQQQQPMVYAEPRATVVPPSSGVTASAERSSSSEEEVAYSDDNE